MVNGWIEAHYGVYRSGTFEMQILVGCDLAIREKRRYIVGSEDGLFVKVVSRVHHNDPISTVERYRNWNNMTNTVQYAIPSGTDDPSHMWLHNILGAEPVDVATTLAVTGIFKSSIRQIAAYKILSSFDTSDLPLSIKRQVEDCERLTKSILTDFYNNPRKPIFLGKLNSFSFFYLPFNGGVIAHKRWKLTGPKVVLFLCDDEVVSIIKGIRHAVMQLEEEIRCKS